MQINNDEKKSAITDKNRTWFKDAFLLGCSYEKKRDRIEALFKKYGSDESIESFWNNFEIIKDRGSLKEYGEKIMDKLNKVYTDVESYIGDDQRGEILMGLSTKYIFDMYAQSTSNPESRQCKYNDFDEYLRESISEERDERSIVAYLSTVIREHCAEITSNERSKLTDDHRNLLEQICAFTEIWISELCQTQDGQFRFLNSISRKKINDFANSGVIKRIEIMYQRYDEIKSFLDYLWKIILDLNRDLSTVEKIDTFLDSREYLCKEPSDIIKFVFDINNIPSGILLTGNSSDERYEMGVVFERMICLKERPRLWYAKVRNGGRHSYDQSVAQIEEEANIANISEQTFWIECMKCLKCGMNKWHEGINCKSTILNKHCERYVKERGYEQARKY